MASKRLFTTALSALCFCSFAGAQQLSMNLQSATVGQAVEQLQSEGYSLICHGGVLNMSHRVHVDASTLQQAVEQILDGQDVSYTVAGNKIIVEPRMRGAMAQQQRKTVGQTFSGRVTDAAGEPVAGAVIKVKGTGQGAVADADGNWTIQARQGDELLFTSLGFTPSTVRLGSKTTGVSVKMDDDNKLLNEVVVVGYGTQKKVNLTGAVSSVDFTRQSSRPVTTASQALAGMAAGVQVLQSSGRPNSEGFGINIRGIGTLNNASPLVLVDGMEMDLSSVNPNDIESISILKDAASCAIYGNRGANGVILVTTKTGQAGKVTVNYSGRFSINTPSRLVRFMDNYADYMERVNEAGTNVGSGITFSDDIIKQWRDAEADPNGIAASGYPNYVAYPNTDWYDAIYKTKVMQEHSLSLLGSESRTRYNLGLTYLDNPGMIVRSGVKKYFVNLNLVSDVTKFLQIGAHMWGYHTDQQRNDVGNLTAWAFLKSVPGVYPYYDGHYGGVESSAEDGAVNNPLLILNGNGDAYYKHSQLYTTVFGQVKFLNDFTFKTVFGYDYYMRRDKYSGSANALYSFSRKQVVTPAASNDQIHVYIYNNHHYNWKWTNTLNWAHTFAKVHDVSALAGFEEGLFYGTYIDTNKYGVIDPTITDMSTVTNMDYIKGDDHESRFRSWFGRLNYAFDSKYLLELDFRYDGSSRFAPKSRWGFFPSASAGWRVSEEKFAKNSFLKVFDNLKLRASYGKLGNSAVDDYAFQSWYETGFAIMGGKKVPRFYLRQLPNIDITWETTKTLNLGLDFSVLNNRLSGVLDYYNRRTTGILYSPSIALTYGDKVSPLQNLAEVSNKGFEMTLRWDDRIGDVTYGVAVNGTWNTNRVEKYKGAWIHGWGANPKDPDPNKYYSNLGEVSSGSLQRIVEGHQMNEFYLRKPYQGSGIYFNEDGTVNKAGGPRDGMIRTEEDMKWLRAMVAAGYKFMPKQTIAKNGIWYGDYILEDANGDGVYGGNYDEQFVGRSSVPKFNFGIQAHAEWKGIDFSMNWGGATGFSTYWREVGQNSSDVVYGLQIPKKVAYDHYFYDPANPSDPRTNLTSKNPRLALTNPGQTDQYANTLRLYNCDFIKLRNLTLGYTFPQFISKTLYAQSIRVYFSGENLLTITSFPGLDPEMRAGAGYTTMRQFSFGVNVSF